MDKMDLICSSSHVVLGDCINSYLANAVFLNTEQLFNPYFILN
jgi:hypothetical protein